MSSVLSLFLSSLCWRPSVERIIGPIVYRQTAKPLSSRDSVLSACLFSFHLSTFFPFLLVPYLYSSIVLRSWYNFFLFIFPLFLPFAALLTFISLHEALFFFLFPGASTTPFYFLETLSLACIVSAGWMLANVRKPSSPHHHHHPRHHNHIIMTGTHYYKKSRIAQSLNDIQRVRRDRFIQVRIYWLKMLNV